MLLYHYGRAAEAVANPPHEPIRLLPDAHAEVSMRSFKRQNTRPLEFVENGPNLNPTEP
jgi:hypothetical protein